MIRLIKWANLVVVKVLWLLFLPLKVRDRVVFVSYFSKKPEGNLACMLNWYAENTELELIRLFSAYGRGIRAKLAFICHSIKETYYYSTSRLILLEGNSFVLASMRKKKGVKAVQVWHAAGAFKRFGQDVERIYRVAGIDAALVSAPSVREIYAHALNVPEEAVFAVGIPRADVFAQPEFSARAREYIEAKYPGLRGKRIALYAPTFRGKGVDDIAAGQVDLRRIAAESEGWALAVRPHPLMRGAFPGADNLAGEDLMVALAAADALITDYSSIIFEYSLLGRPMLFFAPDKENYMDARGFYFGYDDFVPGKICETEEALIAALNQNDFEMEKLAAFCDKFTYHFDGNATEEAARVAGCLAGLL